MRSATLMNRYLRSTGDVIGEFVKIARYPAVLLQTEDLVIVQDSRNYFFTFSIASNFLRSFVTANPFNNYPRQINSFKGFVILRLKHYIILVLAGLTIFYLLHKNTNTKLD
jgi:hypothetical protein